MPESLRPREPEVIHIPDEDRLFDSDPEDDSSPSMDATQPQSDNNEPNTHLLGNPSSNNTVTQTIPPSNVPAPILPPHSFTPEMLAQARSILTRDRPPRRIMDGPEAFRESLHRLIPHIRSATDSVGSTLDLPELGEAHLIVLRNTLASLHELSQQVTLSYELLHTSTWNGSPATAPETLSVASHPLLATRVQATWAGQNDTRFHVAGDSQATPQQDDPTRQVLIQQETALTASTQRTAEALHQATAMMNERAASHGRIPAPTTILGTREEVQQPNYVSPINLMFERAERTARRVEEERQQVLQAHLQVEEARRHIEAGNEGHEPRRLRYPMTPPPHAPMGRRRRFPPFNFARRRSHDEETSTTPQTSGLANLRAYLTQQVLDPLFDPPPWQQAPTHATNANNTVEQQEEQNPDVTRDPLAHAQLRHLRSSLERLEQEFTHNTELLEQSLTRFNGRATRYLEHQQVSQLGPADPPLEPSQMFVQLQCSICQEQIADIALVPCGHLVMCRWCSVTHEHSNIQYQGYRAGSKCPLCRAHIVQRLRIWGIGSNTQGDSGDGAQGGAGGNAQGTSA